METKGMGKRLSLTEGGKAAKDSGNFLITVLHIETSIAIYDLFKSFPILSNMESSITKRIRMTVILTIITKFNIGHRILFKLSTKIPIMIILLIFESHFIQKQASNLLPMKPISFYTIFFVKPSSFTFQKQTSDDKQ
jgi:hypothetical protein